MCYVKEECQSEYDQFGYGLISHRELRFYDRLGTMPQHRSLLNVPWHISISTKFTMYPT